MNPDLERLIRLQQLDSSAEQGRRQLAEEPNQQRALDDRLTAARDHVAAAKTALAEGQTARRELDKSLGVVQGRLSKFKGQLMEVKTNREYTAMQHEIATAERDVSAIEDKLLEHMMAADEVQADLKNAEQHLKREEAEIETARRELSQRINHTRQELERVLASRNEIVSTIPSALLATFETVARRRGIAVTEARQGLCAICNVRLRPQVFNEIRRNDSIIQCDNCSRILYFVANVPAGA